MAISSFFSDSDPSVSRRCWWQWTRRSRSRFHIPSAWVPGSTGVDDYGSTNATTISNCLSLRFLLQVPGSNGNNPYKVYRTGGVLWHRLTCRLISHISHTPIHPSSNRMWPPIGCETCSLLPPPKPSHIQQDHHNSREEELHNDQNGTGRPWEIRKIV